MAVQILQSEERSLVRRLLEIAQIFDGYQQRQDSWRRALTPVVFPPEDLADDLPFDNKRELIILASGFLVPSSEELLLDPIRQMRYSDDTVSLFDQIADLSIRTQSVVLDKTEIKGLFLLAAKFGEDVLFAEDGDEDENGPAQ